jgi:hypothetical protein
MMLEFYKKLPDRVIFLLSEQGEGEQQAMPIENKGDK